MPRLTLPRVLLVCTFVAFSPVAALASVTTENTSAEKSLIVATDLLKLKRVETPALSPDGKWVVYVLRSIETKEGAKDEWSYQTHLWLATTDGKSPPRRLTFGAHQNSAPAWHPDGKRIAFVRGGSAPGERAQIHVLSLDGGEAQPWTKLETAASAPRWSPDGTKLLFSSTLSPAQIRALLEKQDSAAHLKWSPERPGRAPHDVANWGLKSKGGKAEAKNDHDTSNENHGARLPKADPDGSVAEIREWLAKNEADANPRVTTRFNFLAEGDLQAEFSFAQLYVMDAREGAEAKPLAPGFEAKNAAAWLADSRHIVYSAPRNESEHPDRERVRSLAIVNVETGVVRTLLARDDENYGNPTPSPDGQWIAFTLQQGGPFSFDQAKVAIVSPNGGNLRVLTPKLDRQAQNLAWASDSSAVFFTAPDRGAFPLFRATLDGNVTTLTSARDWGVRDFDIGNAMIAQVITHPGNPSELHVASLVASDSRALTRHNAEWIERRQLTTYEAHQLARAGFTVDYWTMKPTNFDPSKQYPLLVQIHGGPSAMWGPGEESMWFEFQFFAAKGYALVFSNPRGSGGYGRTFQRANYRDWGTGPAADVLAAADAAAKQPFVDRERQVLTGGSYGGYLTAWIVAHDHRFKAAVAQRGVYDLVTFFGEGNAWFLVPLYFGGYPWARDVREVLESESPLNYVDQIQTPLLIQHGDVDFRTGVIQSQMLYKSLKTLGRPVEYVRYPRATHEMSRSGEPRQRLDSLVRYEEFFRRFIGE